MRSLFRLLIVDDEEIIVNGLYEILKNLKNIDLDIYKAYSGEEAINWLRRTRMDIVLTDINMPEIDGIQLLYEIQSRWPNSKVIFLTGHANFDYIYNAIQYQNVGYILKSEDPDKVVSAILDAVEDLKKSNEMEYLIQESKEQVNMAKSLLQKELLLHFLHKEQSVSINKKELEKLDIQLNMDFPVILVMGENICNDSTISYMEQVEYVYSMKQIIERKIWIKVLSIIIVDDGNHFYMFLQPKDLSSIKNEIEEKEMYENVVTFMKGTLELVQNTVISEKNAISFIMNKVPCQWDQLHLKFNKFRRILGDIDAITTNNVFIEEELEQYRPVKETMNFEYAKDQEPVIDLKKIHHQSTEWIAILLGRGQQDEYFEKLTEYTMGLKGIESKNYSIAIELYFRCATAILIYINERNLNNQLAFKIGQNKLMRIDLHSNWNEAVDYLFQISKAIFDVRSEEEADRNDKLIDHINLYIEEHISEELSLVKLSEHVYLNPSYLSRFYKRITGENLSDYIDRIRIEKAIAMMKSGKFKINEISTQVGYENPASFTRFFKKMTICTPQDYYEKLISSNKCKQSKEL